jgi:hypothetical protein
MQPPTESRVSTVVDVNLGDRSYPIYIGSDLPDYSDGPGFELDLKLIGGLLQMDSSFRGKTGIHQLF